MSRIVELAKNTSLNFVWVVVIFLTAVLAFLLELAWVQDKTGFYDLAQGIVQFLGWFISGGTVAAAYVLPKNKEQKSLETQTESWVDTT